MTMREKLIEAMRSALLADEASGAGSCCYGEPPASGFEGNVPFEAILDAILTTLAEPDQKTCLAGFKVGEYMVHEGHSYSEYTQDPSHIDPRAPAMIFTAMIKHVREGR
jgi:hypothetical protein